MTLIQPADRPLIDAAIGLLRKQIATAQKSLNVLGLPTMTVDVLESAVEEVEALDLSKDDGQHLSVKGSGALRLALYLFMGQLSKLAERAAKLSVGLEDVELTLGAAQKLSDRITDYHRDWTTTR